jgi:hypothetical protein
MAADDEIRLGSRIATKEPADGDDAVKPLESDDPRGDLDLARLEGETAAPTLTPDGVVLDTGMPDLPAGTDHLGVGADSILDGRVGGSPLDELHADDTSSSGPPADALTGGRDMGLYGTIHESTYDPPPPPPPPPDPTWTHEDSSDDDLEELQVERNVNPDAVDDAAPPTAEEIERALAVRGGDTKPIDGADQPRIDITEAPTPYRDLVTDPGPEGGEAATIDLPRGDLDAPVVHTINPDSGFLPPLTVSAPPASGGEDDVLGFTSVDASVKTGELSQTQGAPLADESADHVGIIIPDTDRPVESAGHVGIIIPDTDRPMAALHEAGDLGAVNLSADLNADLAPTTDDFASVTEFDPGGADQLEGSLPGDNDGDGFPDS